MAHRTTAFLFTSAKWSATRAGPICFTSRVLTDIRRLLHLSAAPSRCTRYVPSPKECFWMRPRLILLRLLTRLSHGLRSTKTQPPKALETTRDRHCLIFTSIASSTSKWSSATQWPARIIPPVEPASFSGAPMSATKRASTKQ